MENEKEADPPPEEWEGAVPHLEWVLKRIRRERATQEEYRLSLIEDLRICELLLAEAKVAEQAVASLLGGRVYDENGRVLQRWDGFESYCWNIDAEEHVSALEYQARPPEPEPATNPPEPPEPTPDPAPSGPVCKTCGGPRATGSANQCRPCYLASAAPPEVPAKPEREADLPPPPWPKAELTEKQKLLFDRLCVSSNQNWTVTVSHGRLSQLTGLSAGSMSAHLYALEKKDMIRVVEHGNSKHPGTYSICEAARPERAEDPKLAEERRIAEIFAKAR